MAGFILKKKRRVYRWFQTFLFESRKQQMSRVRVKNSANTNKWQEIVPVLTLTDRNFCSSFEYLWNHTEESHTPSRAPPHYKNSRNVLTILIKLLRCISEFLPQILISLEHRDKITKNLKIEIRDSDHFDDVSFFLKFSF